VSWWWRHSYSQEAPNRPRTAHRSTGTHTAPADSQQSPPARESPPGAMHVRTAPPLQSTSAHPTVCCLQRCFYLGFEHPPTGWFRDQFFVIGISCARPREMSCNPSEAFLSRPAAYEPTHPRCRPCPRAIAPGCPGLRCRRTAGRLPQDPSRRFHPAHGATVGNPPLAAAVVISSTASDVTL
jgi:hypothetical protein